MNNLDWNQFKAFLETAETGSLSAAARKLGLTQPTLSRQVAAIEQRMGVTLFERVGKSMALTPTGLDLLEHARAMGAAAAALSLTATGRSQAVSGVVLRRPHGGPLGAGATRHGHRRDDAQDRPRHAEHGPRARRPAARTLPVKFCERYAHSGSAVPIQLRTGGRRSAQRGTDAACHVPCVIQDGSAARVFALHAA
jgi:molybdenum-dependent DNA-binding transcriptional regulator ModE